MQLVIQQEIIGKSQEAQFLVGFQIFRFEGFLLHVDSFFSVLATGFWFHLLIWDRGPTSAQLKGANEKMLNKKQPIQGFLDGGNSYLFYLYIHIWRKSSILTSIFFKWFCSTTNEFWFFKRARQVVVIQWSALRGQSWRCGPERVLREANGKPARIWGTCPIPLDFRDFSRSTRKGSKTTKYKTLKAYRVSCFHLPTTSNYLIRPISMFNIDDYDFMLFPFASWEASCNLPQLWIVQAPFFG